jgi:hypothetical protein
MNYRRLENDHTARLFQAYFVVKHFGFVICGSIAASVSPFVATIRHWRSGPAPFPLGRPFPAGMTAISVCRRKADEGEQGRHLTVTST